MRIFGLSLVVLAVVLFGYFVRVKESIGELEFRFDHSPGPIGFTLGVVIPILLCGVGLGVTLRPPKR